MPNDEFTFDSTTRMEDGEAGYTAKEVEKDLTEGELTLVHNSPTTNSWPASPRRTLPNGIQEKFALVLPNITPKQDKRTMIRKLEDFPKGYPSLAAFADSDESFMIYRRFGYIHSRLLFHLQDELRELEAKLHDMDLTDNDDGEEGSRCLRSRGIDEERDLNVGQESRGDLFQKIEQKALQYGGLLLQAQQLAAMNKAPRRDQKSMRIYVEKKSRLVEEEASFVYDTEDLITLRPGRDCSIVDVFVEKMLRVFNCKPLQWIFCSKETARKTDDKDIRYFTRARISICVTLIITLIILLLLVVPIWLLYHLSVTLNTSRSNVVCIGVLLVATLIFSAVLSLFTKAKRHEILAASAG